MVSSRRFRVSSFAKLLAQCMGAWLLRDLNVGAWHDGVRPFRSIMCVWLVYKNSLPRLSALSPAKPLLHFPHTNRQEMDIHLFQTPFGLLAGNGCLLNKTGNPPCWLHPQVLILFDMGLCQHKNNGTCKMSGSPFT